MSKHAAMAYTADTCLFGYDLVWHVLLVRRRWEPFAGCWALSGGYLEDGEDSETAARRELAEETNVACNALAFVGRYRAPGRDPRGPVTTDAYWGTVPSTGPVGGCPRPEPADDAAAAGWWRIDDLPRLAFDHADIIAAAVDALRARHQREASR